jgi:L-threonylcarbamoyladenylate synthase
MNTLILTIDPTDPDPGAIRRAAGVIRSGGLVAFPTETVYGLGANALDPAAVGRVFEAKGRPATNPLIVHVADPGQVRAVAADWPDAGLKLAARFWPGPLTLVVPRRSELPAAVTAGGPTVAVRCPAHPVARALILEAGVPVAAPSANRSTELSPTRAEHVLKGLDGRIEMVLDGGPCPGGIESTVVDVTGEVVRLLRPGPVTVPMLEEVVGRVETASRERERPETVARSPGQMAKHYSPRTPLRLPETREQADAMVREGCDANRQIGWLLLDYVGDELGTRRTGLIVGVRMPRDPGAYAAVLYDVLHQLDQQQLDVIYADLPPDTPEWAAVRDRLKRAAANG